MKTILGTGYSAEKYAIKAAEFGLDKGYLGQLGGYIRSVVTRLDFGKSYLSNIPVMMELSTRIVTTFKIAFMSIILMIIIGFPAGIVAATKQYSPLEPAYGDSHILRPRLRAC